MRGVTLSELEWALESLEGLRGERPRHHAGEVSLRLEGGVALLQLHHPTARQALTLGMMHDLGRHVMALKRWPGGVIVLKGREEAFCAGGFLPQVKSELLDSDRGRRMSVAMHIILDGLRALPQLSVAIVEGPAVGGGAEILTATDERIFIGDAWMQFPQVKLGITAGWGGAARLREQVTPAVALHWLTRGHRISGETAKRAGFVSAVYATFGEAQAREIDALAGRSPAAVRAAKAQIVAATSPGDHADAFAGVWGGAAHRNALDMD